MATVLKSHFCK